MFGLFLLWVVFVYYMTDYYMTFLSLQTTGVCFYGLMAAVSFTPFTIHDVH